MKELNLRLPEQDIKQFSEAFWALRSTLGHEATTFRIDRDSNEFTNLMQVICTTRIVYCALIMKSINFKPETILHMLFSGEFQHERNALLESSSFAHLFESRLWKAKCQLNTIKELLGDTEAPDDVLQYIEALETRISEGNECNDCISHHVQRSIIDSISKSLKKI